MLFSRRANPKTLEEASRSLLVKAVKRESRIRTAAVAYDTNTLRKAADTIRLAEQVAAGWPVDAEAAYVATGFGVANADDDPLVAAASKVQRAAVAHGKNVITWATSLYGFHPAFLTGPSALRANLEGKDLRLQNHRWIGGNPGNHADFTAMHDFVDYTAGLADLMASNSDGPLLVADGKDVSATINHARLALATHVTAHLMGTTIAPQAFGRSPGPELA